MKNLKTFLKTITFSILIFSFSSCDEKEKISTVPNFEVEKFYSEVLEVNSSEILSVQFLEVSLNSDSNFPDGLYVNGEVFLDNGEGYDKTKNDGIFTSSNVIQINEFQNTSQGEIKIHYLKNGISNNAERQLQEEPCIIRTYPAGSDGP